MMALKKPIGISRIRVSYEGHTQKNSPKSMKSSSNRSSLTNSPRTWSPGSSQTYSPMNESIQSPLSFRSSVGGGTKKKRGGMKKRKVKKKKKKGVTENSYRERQPIVYPGTPTMYFGDRKSMCTKNWKTWTPALKDCCGNIPNCYTIEFEQNLTFYNNQHQICGYACKTMDDTVTYFNTQQETIGFAKPGKENTTIFTDHKRRVMGICEPLGATANLYKDRKGRPVMKAMQDEHGKITYVHPETHNALGSQTPVGEKTTVHEFFLVRPSVSLLPLQATSQPRPPDQMIQTNHRHDEGVSSPTPERLVTHYFNGDQFHSKLPLNVETTTPTKSVKKHQRQIKALRHHYSMTSRHRSSPKGPSTHDVLSELVLEHRAHRATLSSTLPQSVTHTSPSQPAVFKSLQDLIEQEDEEKVTVSTGTMELGNTIAPLSTNGFEKMLERMGTCKQAQRKLMEIKGIVRYNYITLDQVERLMECSAFSDEQRAAIVMATSDRLYPQTLATLTQARQQLLPHIQHFKPRIEARDVLMATAKSVGRS